MEKRKRREGETECQWKVDDRSPRIGRRGDRSYGGSVRHVMLYHLSIYMVYFMTEGRFWTHHEYTSISWSIAYGYTWTITVVDDGRRKRYRVTYRVCCVCVCQTSFCFVYASSLPPLSLSSITTKERGGGASFSSFATSTIHQQWPPE